MKPLFPFLCACTLAACGGSQTTTTPQPTPQPTPTIHPASGDEVARFFRTHLDHTPGNATQIVSATAPSGTATLKGFLLFGSSTNETRALAGRATTTVNFDSSKVTGTVKHFGEYGIRTGSSEVSGDPILSSASLVRSVEGDMTLDGTLTQTSTGLDSHVTATGNITDTSNSPILSGAVHANLEGRIIRAESNNGKLLGGYVGGAVSETPQNGQTYTRIGTSITENGVERGADVSAAMIVAE